MSQKNLLIVVLLFFLVAAGAAIYNAQRQTQDMETPKISEQKAVTTGKQAQLEGQNVTFTITEAAQKRWELRVKKALYFEDQSGADLQGVDGDLYNDKGKIVATFTAPAGTFSHKDGRVITLTDGVVVKSVDEEGSQLEAPRVRWSSKTSHLMADGGVHLVRKGMGKSTAQQCEFSFDFAFIALTGNAQSDISP